MSAVLWKPPKLTVDKRKFDAVLGKMIATNPMPLKDVVGTSPPRAPRKRKATKKGYPRP